MRLISIHKVIEIGGVGIRTPDPSNQKRSLNALGYRATYTVMFKIPSYINTELDSIDKMFDINKNNVCSLLFPISKSKNGQLSLSNWALVWSRAIAEQDSGSERSRGRRHITRFQYLPWPTINSLSYSAYTHPSIQWSAHPSNQPRASIHPTVHPSIHL